MQNERCPKNGVSIFLSNGWNQRNYLNYILYSFTLCAIVMLGVTRYKIIMDSNLKYILYTVKFSDD